MCSPMNYAYSLRFNDLAVVWYKSSLSTSLIVTSMTIMTSSNGNIFHVTDPLCGEFTGDRQRPVAQNFDVFFDLRLNKRLGKQSWGWWFETPSRPLWHHCNAQGNYANFLATWVHCLICRSQQNTAKQNETRACFLLHTVHGKMRPLRDIFHVGGEYMIWHIYLWLNSLTPRTPYTKA